VKISPRVRGNRRPLAAGDDLAVADDVADARVARGDKRIAEHLDVESVRGIVRYIEGVYRAVRVRIVIRLPLAMRGIPDRAVACLGAARIGCIDLPAQLLQAARKSPCHRLTSRFSGDSLSLAAAARPAPIPQASFLPIRSSRGR